MFSKLLLNSLYGKLSANPAEYRSYIIIPPDKAAALADPKSTYSFAGELGPWALASRPLEDHLRRYYNVATGASITGYVRAMLWRAIHSSKGAMYCDTDSIACRGRGAAVRLGDALGLWKHEGDFDRAGIAGKKLYIFRGAGRPRFYKTAAKGAKLTHAELWRVAAGGAVEYRAEVPTYSIHKAPHFMDRTITKTTKGTR